MHGRFFLILACLLLSACEHHPLDCALDFVPHDDCLPGTAGYENAQKRAQLAATTSQIQQGNDDATCKSYGLKFGTDSYATCRQNLLSLRLNQDIAEQNNQAMARQNALNYLAAQKANQPKPYVIQNNPTVTTNCTALGNSINCQSH
jgi:hypothetical protein